MALLAIVERINGELKIIQRADMNDFITHHPKCETCQNTKGIHGKLGNEQIFCKWWNKSVEKDGYCHKHSDTDKHGDGTQE